MQKDYKYYSELLTEFVKEKGYTQSPIDGDTLEVIAEMFFKEVNKKGVIHEFIVKYKLPETFFENDDNIQGLTLELSGAVDWGSLEEKECLCQILHLTMNTFDGELALVNNSLKDLKNFLVSFHKKPFEVLILNDTFMLLPEDSTYFGLLK